YRVNADNLYSVKLKRCRVVDCANSAPPQDGVPRSRGNSSPPSLRGSSDAAQGRLTSATCPAIEWVNMPVSKTPRRQFGTLCTRTFALVAIAVGLAVYFAAFFLHASIKTCIARLTPLSFEYGATELTQLNYSPEWAGLVAPRC